MSPPGADQGPSNYWHGTAHGKSNGRPNGHPPNQVPTQDQPSRQTHHTTHQHTHAHTHTHNHNHNHNHNHTHTHTHNHNHNHIHTHAHTHTHNPEDTDTATTTRTPSLSPSPDDDDDDDEEEEDGTLQAQREALLLAVRNKALPLRPLLSRAAAPSPSPSAFAQTAAGSGSGTGSGPSNLYGNANVNTNATQNEGRARDRFAAWNDDDEGGYDEDYLIYSSVSPGASDPFESVDGSCDHASQLGGSGSEEGGQEGQGGGRAGGEGPVMPTPTATAPATAIPTSNWRVNAEGFQRCILDPSVSRFECTHGPLGRGSLRRRPRRRAIHASYCPLASASGPRIPMIRVNGNEDRNGSGHQEDTDHAVQSDHSADDEDDNEEDIDDEFDDDSSLYTPSSTSTLSTITTPLEGWSSPLDEMELTASPSPFTAPATLEPQPVTSNDIRCTFSAPSLCAINEEGEDPKYRKVITHIFGRNKAVTKIIPNGIWVWWCRKHYQRARFRCSTPVEVEVNVVASDGTLKKESAEVRGQAWTKIQCGLVRDVLGNMQTWGKISGCKVVLRRRQKERMEREEEASLAMERGAAVAFAGPVAGAATGARAAAGPSTQGGRGRPSQSSGERQRRPAVPSPVPDWLIQWVEERKNNTISFEEAFQLILLIEDHVAAVQPPPGTRLEVRFPDIEILPVFKRLLKPGMGRFNTGSDGDDDDDDDDCEADSEFESDDDFADGAVGDGPDVNPGADAGSRADPSVPVGPSGPAGPADADATSETILGSPGSPGSPSGSLKRARPAAFSGFKAIPKKARFDVP